MIKYFTICFLLLSFLGCAQVKEDVKGFLGISTKALEEGRKDALVQTFQCDYDSCYEKTRRILKERLSVYIYKEDKKNKLIAMYLSATDTTPVGIFFKEIDKENTQVEVSSPSTFAKEKIATEVFSRLIMRLNPIKGEAEE